MFNRSHRLVAMILAILTAFVGCVPNVANAQGSHYSLTLVNTSGYNIEHLYLSSSDTDRWGPDQLGRHTLESGGSFTLTDIRPGEYDIKFVDEDGDTCIVPHKNVFHNLSWELSQSWLLSCEARHV